MSSYSEGQVHQLADALETRDYSKAQLSDLGQNKDGVLDSLKLVLMGLATIVVIGLKLVLDKDFSSSKFIGGNWSTWKGPADGSGTDGDEDYVPEPDVIDFEQVVTEVHLREEDGGSVIGEEWMKRARASKNRQLGGKAFLALWNDWQACKTAGKPENSILERLRKSGRIGTVIYFFGQTLRGLDGYRCVLYLYFDGGEWYWGYDWLGHHWSARRPSVALASVET